MGRGLIACMVTLFVCMLVSLYGPIFNGPDLVSVSRVIFPFNYGFQRLCKTAYNVATIWSLPATYGTCFGFIYAYGRQVTPSLAMSYHLHIFVCHPHHGGGVHMYRCVPWHDRVSYHRYSRVHIVNTVRRIGRRSRVPSLRSSSRYSVGWRSRRKHSPRCYSRCTNSARC